MSRKSEAWRQRQRDKVLRYCDYEAYAPSAGRFAALKGFRQVKDWNEARTVSYVNEHEFNVRRALIRQDKNPDVWA